MLTKQTYRWRFAPYLNGGGKTLCPKCKQENRYKRYVDVNTKQLLPVEYGKCDREISCGYEYSPYEHPPESNCDGEKVVLQEDLNYYNVIPKVVYKKSLRNDLFKDTFSKFIIDKFGRRDILEIYRVAYSNLFGDSTIFWQIDKDYNIRSGKIMQYDSSGSRVKKEGVAQISWVHNYFSKDFVLKQCFFGEHLLSLYPDKEVRVVESEKTCIVASCVSNEIWLGAGSMYGLNKDKFETLKGRKVVFIPDKGERTFKYWKEKVAEYSDEDWHVTDFLERNSKVNVGDDYADLILKK